MDWRFKHATVCCPNEDCGYCGDLNMFDCDLNEEDFDLDERETVLTCPSCLCRFNATIEQVIDYRVQEEDVVDPGR